MNDLDRLLGTREGVPYSHEGDYGAGLSGDHALRTVQARLALLEAGKGTTVVIGRRILASGSTVELLKRATSSIAASRQTNASEELRVQNHELISIVEELEQQRFEIERVNNELEETNRGVVALYAELDDRARDLKRASESKSRFLSMMSHELD